MKSETFKKLIKEAVREVFQEEMKDILLEAVKSPKPTILENDTITGGYGIPNTLTTNSGPVKQKTRQELRESYRNILGETAASFNSSHAQPFQVHGNIDPVNGEIPAGELSLDQISNIMKKGK